MNLYIFKTDIEDKEKVKSLKPIFNNNSIVYNWSIDLEDTDKVLKVEAAQGLNERDIINLVSAKGFLCETLAD